jgi:hypothetical protein
VQRLNEQTKTCLCGGTCHFSRYCGCFVCDDCENHYGLARCYCGWSASRGDGRRELEEMGETIEPDGDGYYDHSWEY